MMQKRVSAAAVLTIVLAALAAAQQTPPPAQPQTGQQGRGRGGMRGPQPLPYEDRTGFEQIFDGTTLKGWDGDKKFWRVEGGAIVGETSADNKLPENTFIIWRGGAPADFELKVEYKISATNSGIQIRSEHLPAGTPSGRGNVAGNWVLKGYQCDIDYANQYTGQIYEERGRGFLAMRGQMSWVPDGGGPKVVGILESQPGELKAIVRQIDWNQVHVIARGNVVTQILNGRVTSVLIDDDTKGRAMKGLLGFQVHTGDPMKVEFRNIYLKQY